MSASLSVSASRPKVKHSAESILFGFDFTRLLAAGELLTGTPTVVSVPSGPAISSIAVNSATFSNDEGGTVATGAGVQARIAGGAAGTDYLLTVTVITTTGNTRVLVATLQVRDS